jgi:hypothetical protein
VAPDAAERGERPARRDAPAKAGAGEWHRAPDTAYFLKLIDESSDGITIIKATTTVGVEELRALITGGLERDSALAALTGDDGKWEPLNAETLRLGQVAAISKKAFAVMIAAPWCKFSSSFRIRSRQPSDCDATPIGRWRMPPKAFVTRTVAVHRFGSHRFPMRQKHW